MKLEIRDLLSSKNATNPRQGQQLYEILVSNRQNKIEISFERIQFVSTAFLNRSLGKFAQAFPDLLSNLNFHFPKNNPIIELKIKDVIENASLGDSYDQFIDVAEHAI